MQGDVAFRLDFVQEKFDLLHRNVQTLAPLHLLRCDWILTTPSLFPGGCARLWPYCTSLAAKLGPITLSVLPVGVGYILQDLLGRASQPRVL